MRELKLLTLAIIAMFFLGCAATVPMTSKSLDTEAKSFSVPPDKSNIYVNSGGGPGFMFVFHVMLDGRSIGSIAPNTYHLLTVAPGEHTIAVTSNENVDQVKLKAEPGKNYFLKVSVRMGWVTARCKIEVVTEEKGVKMILESERAETTTY